MTPLAVIEALTKANPAVAKLILAGLAVFAAAAIATQFQDIETALLTGTYVLGFAVIASVLAHTIVDGPFSIFIGRALVGVMFIVLLIVIYGTVLPRYSPFQAPVCILRFWLPCEIAADQSAERIAPTIDVTAVPTSAEPAANINRQQYTVWIQFAGFKREDVAKAASALKSAGWAVPSPEKGGERTTAAIGYSEVRYGAPSDKAAAELLTKELIETGLVKDAKAVDVSDVKPNTLEIWIELR